MDHQANDPWKGVFLSLLIPGLGQIFAGEKRRGFFFLLLLWGGSLAGMAYFGWLFFSQTRIIRPVDVNHFVSMLILLGVFEVFVLVDARRAIIRFNLYRKLPSYPSQAKKPWLGALLSLTFPGIGQFYNGQVLKGMVFIGVEIFLLFIERAYYTFPPSFIFGIFTINDAFYVSGRINGSPLSLFVQGTHRQVYSLIGFLFFLSLITNTSNVNLIKDKIIQNYHIPSSSMSPTLRQGDQILVTKYGFSPEKTGRGDVIVFKYPKDKITDYVKRVIGLPGEKIKIVNNRVFINGVRLTEPYAVYNGSRDYGPYTIPEANYFVMGDNRDFSFDSRSWGPVPAYLIKGVVYKIYYPFSRSGPVQ